MKLFKKNSGFTLVEILIATAITITCATIIVAIITSTFRTSNDASSQEKLREAGTGALTQLSSMVRYASKFNGAYSGIGKDETSVECGDPSTQEIKVTSNDKVRTIACDDTDNLELTLDGNPLFDPNNIVVNSCTITCSQANSTDPPVISFSVELANPQPQNGTVVQENAIAPVDLSQTVRMANSGQ